MRPTFVSIAAAIAAAVLVAACATTTPEEQAPAPVTEGGKPGATTPGGAVTTQPVAPVDVTGKPGSPEQIAAAVKQGVLAKRSIYYDLDQYDIKDEYRPLVEAHAKFLRDNPTVRMLVQGNTDERGSREYNVALGQRRADGVKRMMVLLGARENQIEAVSLGEEKPKAEGHDEESWSQNRRSDILYGGEY